MADFFNEDSRIIFFILQRYFILLRYALQYSKNIFIINKFLLKSQSAAIAIIQGEIYISISWLRSIYLIEFYFNVLILQINHYSSHENNENPQSNFFIHHILLKSHRIAFYQLSNQFHIAHLSAFYLWF